MDYINITVLLYKSCYTIKMGLFTSKTNYEKILRFSRFTVGLKERFKILGLSDIGSALIWYVF